MRPLLFATLAFALLLGHTYPEDDEVQIGYFIWEATAGATGSGEMLRTSINLAPASYGSAANVDTMMRPLNGSAPWSVTRICCGTSQTDGWSDSGDRIDFCVTEQNTGDDHTGETDVGTCLTLQQGGANDPSAGTDGQHQSWCEPVGGKFDTKDVWFGVTARNVTDTTADIVGQGFCAVYARGGY